MIFFGHLGPTTGVFKVYEGIFNKNNSIQEEPLIDYRVVLIGSILPDIVDKPIGAFLFRSTFHNSRIFGHTLLFSLILICVGLYRSMRKGKNRILLLGISSSIHLVLDSMWLFTSILFWPYYGLKFPQRPEGNWLNNDLIRLITDPAYYLPETIGFIILACFIIRTIRKQQFKDFIKKGKLV